MNRRDLLATVSTITAMGMGGCVESPFNQGLGAGNDGATSRTVSVGSVNDPSDEHGVALDVNVLQSTMNASQPARLELGMQNVSQHSMMIPTGNREVWSWPPDDHTAGLILYAKDQRQGAITNTDSCWVVTVLADQNAVLIEADLDPQEQITSVREVLGDGRYVDGCPPSGEYRFSQDYLIFDSQREEEQLGEFTWEFTLRLE